MSEQKALELWRKLHADVHPYAHDCGNDQTYCVFCGCDVTDEKQHESDCVYVAACELLGVECK